MRAVLQRVAQASVMVDGVCVGRIGKGLLIFLGVGAGDTQAQADRLRVKISKLRIFADEQGKSNLSVMDVGGEVLVISQFTLYADCRKGTRPSFTNAAPPTEAETLYQYFVASCQSVFTRVAQGVFGAHMDVSLINDGPYTVMLEEQ